MPVDGVLCVSKACHLLYFVLEQLGEGLESCVVYLDRMQDSSLRELNNGFCKRKILNFCLPTCVKRNAGRHRFFCTGFQLIL